ncbi:MAG: ACP S-malonyltransferase [Proteobacteria bacterium]|nr:ACP S-malonyltransferase [Pseudomonadota bacterium]
MAVAFVFPGQGSQSVGMLAELADTQSTVQSTFAEASDTLGYDLWQLVQDGPETELNKTTRTQPALLASSVATWRVWNEMRQARPIVMAGHSLGEYSALVCSAAITFTDAIRLVADRGAYMQDAVAEGDEFAAVDAVGGAGDDRYFTLEVTHCLSPYSLVPGHYIGIDTPSGA